MKKNFKAISLYITAVIAGVVSLSSCISDADSPGLEYTPDMYRSPAIEPYVDYGEIRNKENVELKLKQSAMRPPNYAIPYYGTDADRVAMMVPYHRLASSAAAVSHGLQSIEGWRLSDSLDIDYNKAKADKNPIVLNATNKEVVFGKGKRLFNSMCAHCHGEKGDGEGPMVKSGAYAGVPNYKNLTELGDGQVFYSIYYGKGAMGAHAMMLDKEEIWTLVHYVNKLRFDGYGEEPSSEVEESDSTATAETIEN
jgi:mono/diheme cytochrome c family protein